MSTTTYRVDFFKNQSISVRSSKSASQKITGSSIVSATLHATVDFSASDIFKGGLAGVKALTFNGSDIPIAVTNSTASSLRLSGSASVTHLVVRNGDNTVTVNLDDSIVSWLNPLYWLNVPAGKCNVWLDVEATGNIGVSSPNGSGFMGLPWWVWAIIAGVILVFTAWFLLRTNAGGKVTSAVYGTAKDVKKGLEKL